MVSELSLAFWPQAEPGRLARTRWIAILIAIAFSGILHSLTPLRMLHWHNILQHLYYLPIVFAGMYFGWKGGLIAGVLASISSLPHTLAAMPLIPGYASDQFLDMGLFCAAGAFTGILAQREQEQRRALEQTTARLTEVYQELQQSFEHVKRAERLSALGQLSAGLAHEIRNPLASLAGAAGVLKRNRPTDQRSAECIEIMLKECERLNRLLSEFLDFARPRAPRPQLVEVQSVLQPVVELGMHAVGAKAVVIDLEVAPDLPPVECDPEQIKQAVLNLLLNAIQASPDRGRVGIGAKLSNGRLAIEVKDEGAGIDENSIERIFDPFFTTKENGAGLGLSVVHQIVEQHAGLITAEPNMPRGTIFNVLLPLRQGVVR